MFGRKIVMVLLAAGVVVGYGSGLRQMAWRHHQARQHHWGAQMEQPAQVPAQVVVGANGVLQVCRPLQVPGQ